jgi:hypothetical protein
MWWLTVAPRIDPLGLATGTGTTATTSDEHLQMLKPGQRSRLLCGVSQGDKPIEFTWTKDERPLVLLPPGAAGSAPSFSSSSPGSVAHLPAVTVRQLDADSSVLTFSNLSAVHSGRYECMARNSAGLARYATHLFVQGKRETQIGAEPTQKKRRYL